MQGMEEFKIMAMKQGNPVTVTVNGQFAAQGTVESWSNDSANGGFAVHVKSPEGRYRWFWVREGAEFWH